MSDDDDRVAVGEGGEGVCWILGASDPEMEAVERLLREADQSIDLVM